MREEGKCLGQFKDGVTERERESRRGRFRGWMGESRGEGGRFIPSYIQLT